MTHKEIINELTAACDQHSITEDDTFEYALSIVEYSLKKEKFPLNFIDVETDLSTLTKHVNHIISHFIYRFAVEEPYTKISVKKSILTTQINKMITFSRKYIQKKENSITQLVKKNKQKYEIEQCISTMHEQIYKRKLSHKTVRVNILSLEIVLNNLYSYLQRDTIKIS
jgi:hypothetical protein